MDLTDESLQDCLSDCNEVLYLAGDATSKLNKFLRDIHTIRKHLLINSYSLVTKNANDQLAFYASITHETKKIQHDIKALTGSNLLLDRAISVIALSRELLRTNQEQLGALLTCTDWQSPSFAHTIRSQAGRQINTIYATINDYKRDRHEDATRYERAFVKEYVDNWIKFPVYAYATSSGMAAFTTILNFLLLENKAKGKVLIGNSIWFQNKGLVEKAFGEQIIPVDEFDTGTLLATIKNEQPSVILLDSLANHEGVAVPNLTTIIPVIVQYSTKETYLVIDNTCLSCTLQPLGYVFGKHSQVRLIVFESLNKYHQFGMDRVTGGIIWCYGADTIKLSEYRAHLGTNIPDTSVVSLPAPNRKLLTSRLTRHARNTSVIAARLQSWIDSHPKSPLDSIVYPALANHPSNTWSKNLEFPGSFFTLCFKEAYQSVAFYNNFLTKIMKEARRRNIDIIGGTSFGLNTTHIYLTSLESKPARPFVRVAVGTETRMEIEALATVFLSVFETYR
jgi:cystathionine beta-lyase/cystathionine gamma-synthase